MFGIGGWEFFLIGALALLLFGPDKLPEFARTIGRLMRDFKRYTDIMQSTVRAELNAVEELKTAVDPFAKGKEFREKVEAGEVKGVPAKQGAGVSAAERVASERAAAEDAAADAGKAARAAEGADASLGEGSAPAADAEGAADTSGAAADDAPVSPIPADHPLAAAIAAGEDVGLDDDVDLSAIDPADIGWVPGSGKTGEGGSEQA